MIETHHLSKIYSRGVYALRDLTLTIDKGEFIFLTGPSGAGKSTLLRLLLREDVPTRRRAEGRRPRPGDARRRAQVQTYRRTSASSSRTSGCIPRMHRASRTSRS